MSKRFPRYMSFNSNGANVLQGDRQVDVEKMGYGRIIIDYKKMGWSWQGEGSPYSFKKNLQQLSGILHSV